MSLKGIKMGRLKTLFWVCFLAFISNDIWATHIRAGEITAVRISQSSLRYRFTLVLYKDTGSNVQVGEGGIFNFGQGREIGPGRDALAGASVDGRFIETNIGNETLISVIQFDHTFDGPGCYVISYTEQNRNGGIINMGGAASEDIPFHIETVICIDPLFGANGTPQLTIPPIDRACIGARFIHNAGAFDPDGDSLAYKIVTPMQNRGIDVTTYLPLNDASITTLREDGGAPALFEIDPITGNLTWDAPQFAGEYNVAFIVEEWRFSELTGRYEQLGYVTRDMQIIVEECDNERPELEIPPDTCIEAGTLLEATIIATDPDNNNVLLESFGGVYELNNSPAEFLSLPNLNPTPEFRNQPASSLFRWQTNINHVRARPYEVQFKVSDRPFDPDAPSLVEFKTWNVTVVAPAPTGLTTSIAAGNAIDLSWDAYEGANFAPVMQIYRRVDSYDFTPENCVVGIPAQSGYELIDEVEIGQTNYRDDQNIRPGVNYCYRLVVKFPPPGGGLSYASDESCTRIPLDVPAITNVSIENTSETAGEIFVKWTSPLEIDEALFPPPFTYDLIRYSGFAGSNGGVEVISKTTDTTFVDTGMNTEDLPFHYAVRFYDAADNLIDSSATASSVRLEALGLVQAVELTWEADVPWSNRVQESPYHYIYRNRTDAAGNDTNTFELIDSTLVTADGFKYVDEGQFNGVPLFDDRDYCYYVETKGAYGNPLLTEPFLNKSQLICIQPNDEIPPDEPEIEVPGDTTVIEGPDGPLVIVDNPNCERLQFEPCGFANFSNTVTWSSAGNSEDIASYNVYFSASGAEGSFELIDNTRDVTYTHVGLSSFKGCYRISALDRSNNESPLSAPICFDNCPYYELPNTFTPNADGVNDTFRAFDQPNSKCPRFIESVTFVVYNRWGGNELFRYTTEGESEPNFFIDWDGRDKNGNELPSGTYYYSAIVAFDVLDKRNREQEFKNWVKIIR